jgi:hypothetical protein
MRLPGFSPALRNAISRNLRTATEDGRARYAEKPIRRTVVGPRWRPGRARIWAIFNFPRIGQEFLTRFRPFLIETPHPGGDGERAYLEGPGRLGKRPAPSGAKLEDCELRGRRIMGPSVGLELLHAAIPGTDLFSQKLDLLLRALPFGISSELRIQALRSPALSQRQGGSGKGDDLDYGRADATGPASGKWKRMGQGILEHEQSLGRRPG